MACKSSGCPHINLVYDVRQGDEICTDCGLVIGPYYISSYSDSTEEMNYYCEYKTFILELLERLNVPLKFSEEISQHYESEKKKIQKNLCSEKKNQLICFSTFKVLNTYGIPITLKDINGVSGVQTRDIFKHQSSVVNPTYHELLEKTCSMLQIDFKTLSVIKKLLPQSILSGHNPATVVGATIYKFCREKKLKYTVKVIANYLNISPISIQRYLAKHELSSRT